MLDAGKLVERYEKAQQNATHWMSQLQRAYELVMPDYADFAVKNRISGQRRNKRQWDSTATIAAEKFSSSLQQLLYPEKNWAKLSPGQKVIDGEIQVDESKLKDDCQKWEDLFFAKLKKSNFQTSVFQAILESTISTGVMLVNEGTPSDPFHFTTVPLNQVALEPGPKDKVNNVYRKYKMQADVILQTWPKAKLSSNLKRRINDKPNEEIEILEGTIFNPNGTAGKKFCYFVMQYGEKDYLLYEERSYNPWIIFRQKVLPNEVFGRGKILDLLPMISILNRMAENEVRAADFNSNPIFLAHASGDINPYNAKVVPGSIIPVAPVAGGGKSFEQMSIQANPSYAQMTRESIVQTIQEAMNINPIMPSTDQASNMTATETNARMAEWTRNNQAMVARAIYEGPRQIFNVCWHILHRFGMVPAPAVDDDHLRAEFISAISEMQGAMEVQKLAQAQSAFQQILGPQLAEAATIYGFDVTKLPDFILEKLDVNPEVMTNVLAQQKMLQIAQGMMGQQQPQPNIQQGAQSQAPAPSLQS